MNDVLLRLIPGVIILWLIFSSILSYSLYFDSDSEDTIQGIKDTFDSLVVNRNIFGRITGAVIFVVLILFFLPGVIIVSFLYLIQWLAIKLWRLGDKKGE